MKKLLLVFVLAAIVVVAFSLWRKRAASPAETVTPTGTARVVYKEGRFEPADLTVKPGTAVTFENKDAASIRVSSNPHPIHTALRGFDSSSFSPGESYTYIFTKRGDWGYHNHLSPSMRGTVHVSE